ncbi:DUF421 domain-containing protein [Mesobacillus maritimus]|uniref:DUF421 domain-containing protein n=1 Tax=Mesobacillus maritimus TaxID=1643336 RepID=UPI0020412201|nr:DUF421 domain-containing protein [Mesobacillus maritimus]MCM3671761.1 DUF421 domain-containing protein [Mesobacillus maritimus]
MIPKAENTPVTVQHLQIQIRDEGLPIAVLVDGQNSAPQQPEIVWQFQRMAVGAPCQSRCEGQGYSLGLCR